MESRCPAVYFLFCRARSEVVEHEELRDGRCQRWEFWTQESCEQQNQDIFYRMYAPATASFICVCRLELVGTKDIVVDDDERLVGRTAAVVAATVCFRGPGGVVVGLAAARGASGTLVVSARAQVVEPGSADRRVNKSAPDHRVRRAQVRTLAHL